ncbi:MAG TPA: molybdopterin-dependent oxidoreductase, partial [Chloroflexota bacterium]|nr:molybdopterin-dependent oxidoreductase [Chloroflexota bacterium]
MALEKPTSDEGPIYTGWHPNGRIMPNSASLKTIAHFGYLTPQEQFGVVERGNPLPYTLPLERRLDLGLERETWRLEVLADPDSNAKLEQPLSKEAGTAIDFETLLELGKVHGLQFLKGLACNNIGEPLGMGLWEGVPLRVLVWMARPIENVRRVFYYGYHNDDPRQMFRSSLPIGRVLEEPPGELPVIVCYKLNGEFLTGRRGGPVRMLVPETYGFKSVKWLQRVVLTNHYAANDTYEDGNNDIDSYMKTFARFASVPSSARPGEPMRISGVAQVGVSGLARVQYALHRESDLLPAEDSMFSQAEWHDAQILPPPEQWGEMLPEGKLPGTPLFFDPASAAPTQWPLRYTVAQWQA